MTNTPGEHHAHAEKVDAPKVIFIGLVLFAIVVVTVVVVYQFYNWYSIKMVRELEANREAKFEVVAREHKLDARIILDGTESVWVDDETIQRPLAEVAAQVKRDYSNRR